MRRIVLCFLALVVVLGAVGCSAVSDKYSEGREAQEKRADKMMNDTSE